MNSDKSKRNVGNRIKVMSVFGTRPETIKIAPVIHEMERRKHQFQTVNISSGQHTDLLSPFIKHFKLRIDANLQIATPSQSLSGICSKVLSGLDELLLDYKPDLLLVQGDTTTAMSGALAAFHRAIPIGHIEAGLRSGNAMNPFPEEMNRRIISSLGSLHFAATEDNAKNLKQEKISEETIYVTGNTVVDALTDVIQNRADNTPGMLEDINANNKLIVVTTHRRESFGEVMTGNLQVLSDFVSRHPDISLAFPVHPNPAVRRAAEEIFQNNKRVHLLDPMDYLDFIHLLSKAWLVVSDSGGVQEEAPSLGVPLLVIRENTERPEALKTGVAKLVGGDPNKLAAMLEDIYSDNSWLDSVRKTENSFGQGDSAKKITDAIESYFQ